MNIPSWLQRKPKRTHRFWVENDDGSKELHTVKRVWRNKHGITIKTVGGLIATWNHEAIARSREYYEPADKALKIVGESY